MQISQAEAKEKETRIDHKSQRRRSEIMQDSWTLWNPKGLENIMLLPHKNVQMCVWIIAFKQGSPNIIFPSGI